VSDKPFALRPVGWVRSPLADRAAAPMQGNEGAPEATIEFEPEVASALEGLSAGDEIVILTWLHLAHRAVLRVHPRDDLSQPERGVFGTRSPDRPNPIGLHPVELLAIDGLSIRVSGLEAVDGTPVVDVKPVLRR
jgi:tRNA-Thr(GGU) m(6)t(6)A37 methyltransferase TsaA